MKLKLLFALLVLQLGFAQQRSCGSEQLMEVMMNNPALKQQYIEQQERFELQLQRLDLNANRNSNDAIRIPVAVHYPAVSTTASETLKTCLRNLAQRQLNILNVDYNATNTDISNWASVSDNYPGTTTGSLNVQFVLATQNHPAGTGLAEGSVAVTFGTDFLTAGDRFCTNGCNDDTTWNGYINIVVKNIPGDVLGYSPLGGTPNSGKTVVIDNNAFGASMSPSVPSTCTGYVPNSPFNRGRTLTHELGHFFNLRHTFSGCDGANCATSGDRVCDTPPTDNPRYDCNSADNPPDPAQSGQAVTTCGELQLTMNYMDYVQDACMYMFTAGQAARMQAWYNTIRTQLFTNTLANEEFLQSKFSLYPNPNKGTFTIEMKDMSNSYSIEVFDVTGQIIYENNYPQSSSLVQVVDLNKPSSGIYFVNIKTDQGLVTKKLIIE